MMSSGAVGSSGPREAETTGNLRGPTSIDARVSKRAQVDPDRMTEAFGLYALAGKATAFLAPLTISIVTTATGSQQAGISPLIVLFVLGLILLIWVKPDGDRAEQ